MRGVVLSLPFAVVDFEASSLGSDSYPIEVGVAIARDAATVETWSTLIYPHPAWRDGRGWDPKAQAVHGISPNMLAEGMDPAAALARMNDLLAALGHVWCDGGPYDQHWFDRLRKAAPLVKPAFGLWDLAGAFALDRRGYNRFAAAMAGSEAPHRAGPDAERICWSLIQAMEENEVAT